MIRSICLFIISFYLFGCTQSTSENDKNEKDTSEITAVNVSHETIQSLIKNNQPITSANLPDSIRGVFHEYTIVNESDNYTLIKAANNGTDSRDYYLFSISKNSGKLISSVELGQETEGVQPYKLNWESKDIFSTVDYQYELIEDEESGAYMQGNLLDSVIRYYKINPYGMIIQKE